MAKNQNQNTNMASNTVTNINSLVDEDNWVIHIDKMFRELDLNYLRNYPVCIYHVPKSLSSAKPEAFTPQLVALGPYHHFRPELYPMERFKLTAAKRVLNNLELNEVVEKLNNYGPQIRACFHKYIDLKDDTLIYTMVIDSLFLLDLLQNYAKDHQGHIGRSHGMPSNNFSLTKMNHLVHTGVKLAKDAIIRDVLMLENQIPTCMLRKMIMALSNSEDEDAASRELGSMLLSLCHALSPLPFEQKISEHEAGKHAHLLDLMYHLIIPPQENNVLALCNKDHNAKPEVNNPTTNSGTTNTFKKCLEILKKAFGYLGKLLERITSRLKNVLFLQPVAIVLGNVLKMLHLISTSDSELIDEKDGPVVVMIPSVTELHDMGGVHFRPSKEKDGRATGIKSIRFDEKKRTFYLPEIKLDVNTEVIMRNLVAYEALTKSESLLLTRYTELMRAIVDTVEDVKLLKKSGTEIIKSNLKDKEAEELFNGMSKSIGPTRTPDLEREIAKVNKYFNNTDKVKAYRLISKYVYSSWKLCTLFATFVLLGLMVLQTLCSVYDCPRALKTGRTGTK